MSRAPYKGSHKARVNLAADFETTTDPNDCRVWLWGVASIDGNPDEVEWGIDILSFLTRIASHNSITYFHNLKFDGHFIMDWLLNNGYTHVVTKDRDSAPGTFKSLISDMGKIYSITVRWHNGHSTEFRDSLKKLPMSVKRIAQSFKLPEGKGEIDYDAPRPVGYQPIPEEIDYLRRDVSIVAKAMKEVLESGMTRLTVASDSLAEYKRLTSTSQFNGLFPTFSDSMDAEIRRAYRGGFTYADTRFKGRLVGSGLVLDVNSLYPYIMKDRILPFGMPEFVRGVVLPTDRRPLTIFSVTFTAKLKPDHIPCIQIKNSGMFAPTEYLTEISEPTTLSVTNVDWALYNEHYDIEVLAWGNGWRFKAARGMFDNYIDKWSAIKATEKGGKREIAKLHLNSLYGKFATNPNVTSKIPVLKDGVLKYERGEDEKRAPVYTPAGVFITSFARDLTIRAAQENYATFAYADTDSLHLLQEDVPSTINVHPTELGAWKLEYHFDAAYYIRAKAYLEHATEPECGTPLSADHSHSEGCYYVNRIAGLPESISRSLTFDQLREGLTLNGKLIPKSVPGGVVLKDIPFELKLS